VNSPLKWATLFYRALNVHLVKDVGMIPYYMGKLFDVQARLVTYRNERSYSHPLDQLNGFRLEFIERIGRVDFLERAVLRYLWQRSANFDVLHLFHLRQETIVFGLLYKWLNPNGFLYVKLDLDVHQFQREGGARYSENPAKHVLFTLLERVFLPRVDLFSVETKEGLDLFVRRYPTAANKTVYLPNGIDDLGTRRRFPHLTDPKIKEDVILSVGRVGTEQKNTEMLLSALSRIDLKGWRVRIIGPLEPLFNERIEEFFSRFPHLRDSIQFTGEISDRQTLLEWYDRARVFAVSSRWEGFSIAMVEASYSADYLVSTDVSAVRDITAHGQWGRIVKIEDTEEMASALQWCIDHPEETARIGRSARAHALEHFVWHKIIPALAHHIRRRGGPDLTPRPQD
jgi:glycosyltransferase involved in cell wall biosynthesis